MLNPGYWYWHCRHCITFTTKTPSTSLPPWYSSIMQFSIALGRCTEEYITAMATVAITVLQSFMLTWNKESYFMCVTYITPFAGSLYFILYKVPYMWIIKESVDGGQGEGSVTLIFQSGHGTLLVGPPQ